MSKNKLHLIVLTIITILILGVSFAFAVIDNVTDGVDKKKPTANNEKELEEEDKKPKSFTGLLVGLDASKGLTDVLMVGVVNTETDQISVISVPRDLHIDFRDEMFREIKKNNPNNYVQYCKLTEVYSAVGRDERALQDVKAIIEIITGLEIDYMASIDVNGFSNVVDVIDGVEFDVPQRMYYRDPNQNLYIDLQPGYQVLDGDKAEQLVRFRSYVSGDLQRIQVQQDFMIAFYNKVMSLRDFQQIKELATTAYGIFEADFGLLFALNYAQYFYEMDVGQVLNKDNMVTIPSYGEKINELWYEKWDIDEAHEIVEELLYEPAEGGDSTETTEGTSEEIE